MRDISGGGSFVKSIQRGVFVGNTSNYEAAQSDWGASEGIAGHRQPIGEVDVDKSIILLSGAHGAVYTGNPERFLAATRFVSSTEIELAGVSSVVGNVQWQVLELNAKTVQKGVGSFLRGVGSGKEHDISIGAVNLDKSFIVFSFNHNSSYGSQNAAARFIDNETLRVSRQDDDRDKSVIYSWGVVEYA